MAAFAYVLLPLSGLIAFLVGDDPRMRFHGLQAIAVGLVWALAAYVASWIAPPVTLAVFLAGALLWLILILSTLLGRDLRLPGSRWLDQIVDGDRTNGEAL